MKATAMSSLTQFKKKAILQLLIVAGTGSAWAQLTDRTLAPNNAQAGIAKSLEQEIGAGRGDS